MIDTEYRVSVSFTHEEGEEADAGCINKWLLLSSKRFGRTQGEPDELGRHGTALWATFDTLENARLGEEFLEGMLGEARACLEEDQQETKAEYSCPVCGSTILEVYVEQVVVVDFDPDNASGGDPHEVLDGPRGDMEWDDTSTAQCNTCGHLTHLGDMHKP